MLVVLSELNCLNKLNNNGIYPDKFYTDVDTFRNSAISFNDANIIVIFAGNCSFNKKHTIELVKSIKKRADNAKDNGIANVFVLSDTELPLNFEYYRFDNDVFTLTLYDGKKKKGEQDFWGSVHSEPKKADTFLSDYDKGVYSKEGTIVKRSSSEESLIRLIKIPDIKQMLSQAN